VGSAGPNNDIKYEAIDISSTSIVVGGYCKDTTVCGTGTNPLIELFDLTSHMQTWSKYVPQTTTLNPDKFGAVRFSPDATKIMAGTQIKEDAGLSFIQFDASNGAILST
jgi:hypothetical protein